MGRHGEYDPYWVSKLLNKPPSHTRPPSLQGSLRHHRRGRSLSARSGVPVFVAVEEGVEQGGDEHGGRLGRGEEQWPPWNELADHKSTVQFKDANGGMEERNDKVNKTETEKEHEVP